MRRIACSVVILSLILISPIEASDTQKRFTVGLNVKTDNSIKLLIESNISRELRSLGDVEKKNNDPLYEIAIVATQAWLKNGQKAGIVLSVNFISYFYSAMLKFSLESKKKPEDSSHLIELSDKLCTLVKQNVYLSSYENLHNTCKKIVADFDVHILDPHRWADQQLLDLLKKPND